MSIHISLTLEASEMFLSLHMIFSLERTAVGWAILERISGFDPSLEMSLVISRPLMLALPSWSSRQSDLGLHSLPRPVYLKTGPLWMISLKSSLDLHKRLLKVHSPCGLLLTLQTPNQDENCEHSADIMSIMRCHIPLIGL